MKASRLLLLPVVVVACLTPCFGHHLAVIANKENKAGKMTSLQLARLIRQETKTWPAGQPVIVVLHNDSSAETTLLEKLLRLKPEEYKALLKAHRESIRMATSDAGVLEIVQSTPGSLGLVEVHSIDGSVDVVKIDGKLPMESGYLEH
jgi:ABC-type phosphate transport system substrate-binding protein